MNFASDNTSGVHPRILEALSQADAGTAMPYGADAVTARMARRVAEVFETDAAAFPVATGTAANALALSAMTPPWGAVYCHRDSHINTDECGAPELFSGGAKLVPLEGAHGRLTPSALEEALGDAGAGVVHHVQPAVLSLTQATEAGTVYSPDEVAALAELAHAHGLRVHMDGARFANALVQLGCTPAELTWKAGVDALAFGATKNGAMAAEAALFFDPALAETVAFRRKRGGHLFSKMRYLSAQLEAYLRDDVWLVSAAHANAMAQRLSEGLGQLPGVDLLHPVEANEVFAALPAATADALEQAGFAFYRWGAPDARERVRVRLVASWNTAQPDVERFLATAARAAGAGDGTRAAE
jgi:threonine aldolase